MRAIDYLHDRGFSAKVVDNRLIVSPSSRLIQALPGLERVYREGFAYSKAELLLLGLCQRN